LAGAYPRDTESVFGHVFLVYAPENRNVPFLNWTAVNFAANIAGAGIFELYHKGLLGGFDAYYYKMSLHELIREYAGKETRDIRFFPIKLSDVEYTRFIENLDDKSENPIPYLFFTNNCAHGIYQILFESLKGLPQTPQRLMSPLSVVSILHEENRLEEPFILLSAKSRILSVSDTEQAELEFLEWQNQQGLARYDAERDLRMAHLRVSMSQKNTERREMFSPDIPWTDPHKYSRIESGSIQKGGNWGAYINYRPMLHNQSDNQHFYSGVSTLEILSPTVVAQSDKVYLESLDIFHSRSTPIYDKWFRSISYDLYLGFVESEFKGSVGLGLSYYLFKKQSIAMEILLKDSFIGSVNHIGLETQILNHTTGRLRYGMIYEHLYKGFSSEISMNMTTWMAFDFNKQYGLYFEYLLDNRDKGSIKMGVRGYF